MQVYKDLSSSKAKEFKELLNKEFAKSTVEENQIVESTVSKVTPKLIFLEIPGSKAEATLDINEIKLLKKEVAVGEKLSVFIENREDRFGNCIVSFQKAEKLKSWNILRELYENKEDCIGEIQPQRIKGGWIVSIKGLSAFLPGSQVDLKPLKNINHLLRNKQKFRIVKMDKVRGNVVVSRREVLADLKNASKEEMLKNLKEGMIINSTIKNIQKYGIFHDCNGIDSLTILQEASWHPIEDPHELFSIGKQQRVVIHKIENGRISTSIKRLTPDPFETELSEFKVGGEYFAIVRKIMDFGCFLQLENSSLQGLLYKAEISWTQKNVIPNKFFSVSQRIKVVILSIDQKARRISFSYKKLIPNDWEIFGKKYKIGDNLTGKLIKTSDFALFIKIDGFDLIGMIHVSDINYNPQKNDLKAFQKNDSITAQLIEFYPAAEKIRLSIRANLPDPLEVFKKNGKPLKTGDIVTVKILKIEENALRVAPEDCPISFLIKRPQISMHRENQRVSRFNVGNRIDCAVKDIDLKKKRVSLSIKLLEEIESAKAIKEFGSVDSGRALPFNLKEMADLNKTLKKNKGKKEK